MKNYGVFLMSVIGILQGCAVPASVCPKLQPPVLAPVPQPFLPRMQQWLSGSEVKPTSYELTTPNAKPSLTK